MDIFNAIILGIIQGITEFLPISSTAHLTIAGKVFGLIDPNNPEEWTAFIAIIQLGTVAAVVFYFYRDIVAIIHDLFIDLRSSQPVPGKRWSVNSRHAGQILIGTVPVVIVGLVFKNLIEGNFTKSIPVIATSLILLAVILNWAEKVGKQNRDEAETTWKDALIIGIAQAFALIPGSSRSGTTITASLFLGLNRPTAARFSFLLSIPAVLASGLFQLYEERELLASMNIVPLLVCMVVSGITGYAAISFLIRYLKGHTTHLFIWYRIGLGLLLWTIYLTGVV